MLFSSLSLAFRQLPDPAFRAVLIKGFLITLAVLVLTGIGVWWGLSSLPSTGYGWLDGTIAAFGGIGFLLLKLLLFPLIMTAVVGLFLDDVAEAVEAKYYPHLPPGRPQDFWPALWNSLRFLGVVLLVNFLLLPVYLLLLFFPPLKFALYYAVNGYLLGREYYETVAFRYLPRAEADRLRRLNRGNLWLGGVLIVVLLTIPLLNLIVPIVATAFMVHVFRRLSAP